jgi:energy-coupling factor transporter ATP-binding protein EcfA2
VGVTCVMVTHDQEEAMTMAQRIAIMHLGWIARSARQWTSTRHLPAAWCASSSVTSTCSKVTWSTTPKATRSLPARSWSARSTWATASPPRWKTSTSPTPCARKRCWSPPSSQPASTTGRAARSTTSPTWAATRCSMWSCRVVRRQRRAPRYPSYLGR